MHVQGPMLHKRFFLCNDIMLIWDRAMHLASNKLPVDDDAFINQGDISSRLALILALVFCFFRNIFSIINLLLLTLWPLSEPFCKTLVDWWYKVLDHDMDY